MLRKLLKIVFPPMATPLPVEQSRPLPPPRQHVNPGTPIYPPADQGIISATPHQILDTQSELVRRIKLLAGTNDAEFEARYLSVIRQLANYIQLLPASETDTHNGPGGLFRLCVELAFYSAQAAEGVVFAGRASTEERRREEPRWRYAAFLAGMNCELHRCVTAMTVVDMQGRVWPAFNLSLTEWLAESGSDRYFIRWTKGQVSTATAGLLVNKIASSANLQYLQDGSARIVPAMMDTIAGVRTHDKTALTQVVDQVRDKVVHRDKSVQPANYGKLSVGSHLEPHLIDAMRQIVSSGKWVVNERKSRLWYAKSGLFLVWRMAAKEIMESLASARVSGIPQDAQTLLEVLLAAKVFVQDKDGSPYWMIIPPGEKAEIVAVKFTDPMTLFGTMLDEVTPVEALDGQLPTAATEEKPAKAGNQAASVSASPEIPTKKFEPELTIEKVSQPTVEPPQEPTVSTVPGGAIPEVAATSQGAKMPSAVAATLRPATREVMNALLNEHLTRKSRDQMGAVDTGFAIAIEHMASFGVTLEDLLKNLQEAGWLYAPPEKPNKKLHQVVFNNRNCNVVIIKPAQARDAGFIAA